MPNIFERLRAAGHHVSGPIAAATTRAALVAALLAPALAGCAAPGPRVVEVLISKQLQVVPPGTEDFGGGLRKDRRGGRPKELPPKKRCELIYVRWTPDTIGLVRFEYRQPQIAGRILEQTFVPDVHPSTTFRICGDELAEGGFLTAWRVTLWQGDQLVAEKQSSLW